MSVYEKVGGEFAVNGETAGNQTNAQITSFADGSFLITWVDRETWPEDGQTLKCQLYAASGAKLGSEFQINEPTANAVFSQTATALGDGSFVVTWIDSDLTSSAPSVVKARLFDGAG